MAAYFASALRVAKVREEWVGLGNAVAAGAAPARRGTPHVDAPAHDVSDPYDTNEREVKDTVPGAPAVDDVENVEPTGSAEEDKEDAEADERPERVEEPERKPERFRRLERDEDDAGADEPGDPTETFWKLKIGN